MSFSHIKETIEEGDTVILYIGIAHIYALEVKPKILSKKNQEVDNVFQTQYGCLKVMDLVGMKFGSKVTLSKGWAHVLYPTPELWTVTLPHRTQILYTPDISMVIMELDIGPGSQVCEAGTGSGSLSHAFLRTIGNTGHLYTCDFHQNRVDLATDEFKRHGHSERVTVTCRDVCANGWGIKDKVDAVFMDLPNPWMALPHAIQAVKKSGGRICSFSPCIEQVMKTCELMEKLGLTDLSTLECLQRVFQVKTITSSLPPLSEQEKDDHMSQTPKKVKIDSNSNSSQTSERNSTELKNNCESTNNVYKFKTAVPVLKMAGHTGYLTFATVPPNLCQDFSSVLDVQSENENNSAENSNNTTTTDT